MSVIRNTFTGTLSANPNLSASYQTYTITGLTSETSTTNVNTMNPEASLHFLNALYKTIVDAGYGDAIKNDGEYSITVLGFKFFVFIVGSSSLTPCIYTTGEAAMSFKVNSASNARINNSNSPYTELEYNITVRGDSNHISFYYGSYPYPMNEYYLFTIAKGKNLITSSDIYMFGNSVSSGKFLIRERNNLYNYLYNSDNNPLDRFITEKGLNTNSKFVCVPQLAYNNTCLVYSMVQGNNAVFTSGKYYKIGNDIYYNENNYLYKVG